MGTRPCVRCLSETDVIVRRVPMCFACKALWNKSPEFNRLKLIEAERSVVAAPFLDRERSIIAEWIERLRCEETVRVQANAVAESPKATEDT